MTVACEVCGATVEAVLDCPVCGAALPAPESGPEPAPDAPAQAPGPDDEPAQGVDVEPRPPSHLPPPRVPAPAPPVVPSAPSGVVPTEARNWAVWTHLSAFVAAFFLVAFVGPLILWLARRELHPFVDHHGKEAVNFNLSMLLYLVLSFLVALFTLGFGLLVVLPAGIVLFGTWVVAPIVAAVKANRGEGFRYPVTIRFLAD